MAAGGTVDDGLKREGADGKPVDMQVLIQLHLDWQHQQSLLSYGHKLDAEAVDASGDSRHFRRRDHTQLRSGVEGMGSLLLFSIVTFAFQLNSD